MTKTAAPKPPKTAGTLAKLVLRSPRAAGDACRAVETFIPSLQIFLAFLIASVFYLWWKPVDFPQVMLRVPAEQTTLAFWMKSTLVQLPLEAASIAFTVAFIEWLRKGSFPVKFVSAVAWCAFVLVINIVAYTTHSTPSSKPLFLAGTIVGFGLIYPVARHIDKAEWISTASFLLAVNAIGIVWYIPMAVAVLIHSEGLYQGIQVVGLLWLLVASALGLRATTGAKLRATFLGMIFAMCFQIALAFTLHFIGVPGNWLKAAMLYG